MNTRPRQFTAGLYPAQPSVIRAAVDAALDGGINLTGHNLLEAELARLVTQRFPSLERLRFTNSGTEANLLAITAARHFTGRRQVMVFKGAYHGGMLTFAAGPSPVNVPFPFVIGTYNDSAGAAALVKEHAADLAAIVVEPCGAGGCIVGDPASCANCAAWPAGGALLVFDEVMISSGAWGPAAQIGPT